MSGTSLSIDPKIEHGYNLLREDSGLLRLGHFEAVEFTGDDRKGWLQGQITNDLRNFVPGGALRFCICSPTGQLLADCDLWSLPDRFIITTDAAAMPALLNRCETMVILEEVSVRPLAPTHEVVSIQGPTATSRLGRLLTLPAMDGGEAEIDGESVITLRSNRTGYGGWDLLLPKGAATSLLSNFEEASLEAYDIARLEAGIPRHGADITAKTLPPEMGPAFETSRISYKKGCYTGQEVLMRMHTRGHTNRTWMALLADEPLVPGASVSHGSRPDAGTVTSAAFSPRYGHIGAAMLRNEAAGQGEIVMVQTPDGPVEAEALHMPILGQV